MQRISSSIGIQPLYDSVLLLYYPVRLALPLPGSAERSRRSLGQSSRWAGSCEASPFCLAYR
ncbi:hypothetical protein [Scytonema sp. PRP1]|uniref:hypothetical protein n=1 Tax=Scytonema sp. PRP1 TaxID=3120513 RepID=UPI002FD61581